MVGFSDKLREFFPSFVSLIHQCSSSYQQLLIYKLIIGFISSTFAFIFEYSSFSCVYLELSRQISEKLCMIVLVLHIAHLLLVLDLAPRQLTRQKLDNHVEQTPQVVMAAHLLILVGVHRRITHRSSESGLRSGRPHLALGIRVFARQTKIKHEYDARICGQAAHREIRRLDVTMQKADSVYALYYIK